MAVSCPRLPKCLPSCYCCCYCYFYIVISINIVIVIIIVQVSCPRLPTCSQSSQGKPLSAQAYIIWSRNCRNGFWWSTQWQGRKWLSSGECRCIIVFASVIAIVIIVVIVIVQVPAQGLGLSHLWRGPTQQWRLGRVCQIDTFPFWKHFQSCQI